MNLNYIFATISDNKIMAVSITVQGIIHLWQKFHRDWIKWKGTDEDEPINECLFFSPELKQCKSKRYNKKETCDLIACSYCSFNRLMYYLNKTEKSLDICVYNMTVHQVYDIVVTLFKRGVFVRIITDRHMSEEAGETKVVLFRKEHIPMKVITCSVLMHNKFIVMDKKIVMTGSLNLTRQATQGSFENVLVTGDRNIAGKFNDYFDYIWKNAEEFSEF